MLPPPDALPTLGELLQRAVERHGDRVFLVGESRQETFAEAGARVERTAGWLAARGVGAGDRVVLQGSNSPALIGAWLAAVRLGALPVPVSPALTRPELDRVLDDTEPRAVLADGQRAETARAAAGVRRIAAAPLDDPEIEGCTAPAPARPAVRPGDPAVLVYTSGTTSRPKPVIVTHAALVLSGEAFPSWIGLGAEERLWACLPLSHMNAQAYSLTTAIAHGYSLAVTPRFSASAFWREAAALGVTAANVIGAMLEILARTPPDRWVPSGLRVLYTAPAPAPERRAELERRFGVRLVSGYGMSESPFGCIESDTSAAKASCIGRPRLHPWRPVTNELRVVDGDGRPLARGETGELQLRNPTVSPGYWGAARQRSPDDWLATGDLGYIDADGDVILAGRSKEMIRRRGENIAPGEIEDALLAHPAVLSAAAVGIPSALSEEDVAAVVVLRDGAAADPGELRRWCGERLADFKVPDVIAIRSALPMTPTMRVARRQLADELAGEARADA